MSKKKRTGPVTCECTRPSCALAALLRCRPPAISDDSSSIQRMIMSIIIMIVTQVDRQTATTTRQPTP
eukprot:2681836-Rhodomonas_salina.1